MKTVKEKHVLVGADRAGFPLKQAVVVHLKRKGWQVKDIGVIAADDPNPKMFHRIGIEVGSKIAEREYERALIFCGTGMGISIAASKCPHVHAAVCESVAAAKRCVTGNNCNVLAMGAHYVAPQMGIEMADAFLENDLGTGYEWWENFYEFHKLAYDELEAFNYDEYKESGFVLKHLGECLLEDKINDKPK